MPSGEAHLLQNDRSTLQTDLRVYTNEEAVSSALDDSAVEFNSLGQPGEVRRVPPDAVLSEMTLGGWPNTQYGISDYGLAGTSAALTPPLILDPAVQHLAGSTASGTPFSATFSPMFSWLSQPSSWVGAGAMSAACAENADAALEDFGHVGISSESYENLELWTRMMHSTWQSNGTGQTSISLRLPPLNALNTFIQLYFEEFHDTLPIIHRPTFDPSFTPCLLILAIANVGRRFSRLATTPSLGLDLLETLIYDKAKRHVRYQRHRPSPFPKRWPIGSNTLISLGRRFTSR